VFQEGQIVEDGTHASLLELGGSYYKLWAAQNNGMIG
jgi:ABC-type multidrug transport system fused ATPase/permease subunit